MGQKQDSEESLGQSLLTNCLFSGRSDNQGVAELAGERATLGGNLPGIMAHLGDRQSLVSCMHIKMF